MVYRIRILFAFSFAIQGTIKVIDKLIVTTEELAEANEELRDSYEETITEIESIDSRLVDIKSRIAELNNAGPLSITDKQDLENLILENRELEYQKTLLEENARLKASELNAGIEDEYDSYYPRYFYIIVQKLIGYLPTSLFLRILKRASQ